MIVGGGWGVWETTRWDGSWGSVTNDFISKTLMNPYDYPSILLYLLFSIYECIGSAMLYFKYHTRVWKNSIRTIGALGSLNLDRICT